MFATSRVWNEHRSKGEGDLLPLLILQCAKAGMLARCQKEMIIQLAQRVMCNGKTKLRNFATVLKKMKIKKQLLARGQM